MSTWTPPPNWTPKAYAAVRPPAGLRVWRWPLVLWAVASVLVLAAGGLLLMAALGASVTRNTHYETLRVPSTSMAPTYPAGSKVTFKLVDGGAHVHRGDVVLFSMHDWDLEDNALKRVIGVGGDRVRMTLDPDPRVIVNGKPLDEPYIAKGSLNVRAVDVVVPPGRLFLLGDNRRDSLDSRYSLGTHNGTIPQSAVRGIAVDPSTVPSYPTRTYLLTGAPATAVGLASAVAVVLTARRRARRNRYTNPYPAQPPGGSPA